MSKVLIVDDDEGFLFIIGEYLEAYGLEYELASSPKQARKHLMAGNYDAIVSDLEMPGESGLDLFRYISPRLPRIPFIIMTGCTDARTKREALEMGVSKYIEKPFRISDLIQLLSGPGTKRMGTAAFAVPLERMNGKDTASTAAVN